MIVCEIFAGIQGESTYAGMPCVFVRLTGCNLRCFYCDTEYAYEEGMEMSEDEILERVKGYGIKLVEITGGEPLLQKESLSLIRKLLDIGFEVLVETNGSEDISDIDERAVVIMDIKPPGSGMFDRMNLENLQHLKKNDEVKFVITGRDDYDWVKGFIEKHCLMDKCIVLLSPAYSILSPESLCKWIIEDRLSVRLNLQIHKYIYDPEKRGV